MSILLMKCFWMGLSELRLEVTGFRLQEKYNGQGFWPEWHLLNIVQSLKLL